MATNSFGFKVTTTDSDGNSATEQVGVNLGPSSTSTPQVVFVFPSGVRAEAGDSVRPAWGASTKLAMAYIKVYPTVREDQGGTGRHLIQFYSTSGKYPNSPDRRFHQTYEGRGGQLATELSSSAITFMTVTSGTGVEGSGLAQSTDLVGLRYGVQVTNDASATGSTTRSRTGTRRPYIGTDDEIFAVYDHDLSNDKVYTLYRDGRSFGRTKRTWTAGSAVQLYPYHLAPLYSNTGASDIYVNPHVVVIEQGVQFPLTGRFTVSGTSVTGSLTDILDEIPDPSVSGTAIRFADNDSWYIVSGLLSSSGLVIYDYGDDLYLTDQPAEIAATVKGSGLVAILPEIAGCGNWGITMDPFYADGDVVESLDVEYTVSQEEINPGGASSGTLLFTWEEWTHTDATSGSWSGLVPGNLATQSVSYENNVPKNIRVTVQDSGQLACTKQIETGFIGVEEGVSAGKWYGWINTGYASREDTNYIQASPRVAGRYYHHNVTIMKPKSTRTTSSIAGQRSFDAPINIGVDPGTIDTWPEKGTVFVRDDTVRTFYGYDMFGTWANRNAKSFLRYRYYGKTNSSLMSCRPAGVFYVTTAGQGNSNPYEPGYWGTVQAHRQTSTVPAGSDVYHQMVLPYKHARTFSYPAANKVKVDNVWPFNIGTYVRFAPTYFRSSEYNSAGGGQQPPLFQIIARDTTNHILTLNANLPASITTNNNMLMIHQPYDDVTGTLNSIAVKNYNIFNTNTYFCYGINGQALKGITPTELAIWNPMNYLLANIWDNISSFPYQNIPYNYGYLNNLGLPPVGRMIIPAALPEFQNVSSFRGTIIEYDGFQSMHRTGIFGGGRNVNGQPTHIGPNPGPIVLQNVKVVRAWRDDIALDDNYGTVYPGTVVMPFNDVDWEPSTVISIEPTDSFTNFLYEGAGVTDLPGYSLPIANNIYTTLSLDDVKSSVYHEAVPWLDNHFFEYTSYPRAGQMSIITPYTGRNLSEQTDIDIDIPDFGGACIHYTAKVDVWDGEQYNEVMMRDLKVGDMVRTPDGPREVLNKTGGSYEYVRILNTRNGRNLMLSDIHPVALIKDGKQVWRKAMGVRTFDTVVTVDGEDVVDANIVMRYQSGMVHGFWDIEVEGTHTFFAEGILVHNKVKQPPYEV